MKILLSGGGTAGHTTPLLAVARAIKAIDPNISVEFIGQKNDKNVEPLKQGGVFDGFRHIYAGKFRRFHSLTLWQNITNFRVNLLNLRDFCFVIIGFVQALFKLSIHRPDAILCKGGFVVVPVGMAARLLRIPYMTHDSDPIPGLANRIIASGARKNAVVSEMVRAYPPAKTIVTGIPLMEEYAGRRNTAQDRYKQLIGYPKDSVLMMIYTGTQGAKRIDDALETILPELLQKHPKLEVQYVFGRLNEGSMDARYSGLSHELKARIHPMTFVSDAYDRLAASDIVVARAGATTLAEIATIGRACVIIPAEQLTGGHQLLNAEPLKEAEAAMVVREVDLADELLGTLDKLISDASLRSKLSRKITSFAPKDAAGLLARELLTISAKNRGKD